jgi:DNA repair protein RecN (Recombination protein N)
MERKTGVGLSMLRELRIKNIALIEDVTIGFESGFSVFTGETGAGKSILVGAIGLLLGERATSDLVRVGSEEAEVCGIFELKEMGRALKELLTNNNVSVEDGALILRRTVSTNNRNRMYINQVPVPLSMLKKAGDVLVDFHGQHEHQSLLNPETALSIIDSLRGVDSVLTHYNNAFNGYQDAKIRLETHDRATAEREQKREVIEFQYNELKNLGLCENEEIGLEEELRLLSSTAQRVQCVSQIEAVLSASEASLSSQIQAIRKNLETLNRFDPAAGGWLADIGAASTVFAELESFCGSYLEKGRTAADPERIESINDRLAKIQRLKKKYSCSFGQLFDKMNTLKNDLEALENAGADRSMLEKELKKSLAWCAEAGAALGTRRRDRAAHFDAMVTKHMEKLGFPGGLWHTEFTPNPAPQPHGLEDCAFLIRTNPGEQTLPLIKIASGGEISRLMLAVKTVLAAQDDIPVLVFDEIDTGIGGMLAKEVAKSLVALSASHQLLCISHLHQIASQADHHYHVYKEEQGGRTVTRVEKLGEKERVDEIARMLGGETAISRKHAEELLGKK